MCLHVINGWVFPMSDNDIALKPKTKVKLKLDRPKLYKVILVNDDYTPRELVIMPHAASSVKKPGEFSTCGHCQKSQFAESLILPSELSFEEPFHSGRSYFPFRGAGRGPGALYTDFK